MQGKKKTGRVKRKSRLSFRVILFSERGKYVKKENLGMKYKFINTRHRLIFYTFKNISVFSQLISCCCFIFCSISGKQQLHIGIIRFFKLLDYSIISGQNQDYKQRQDFTGYGFQVCFKPNQFKREYDLKGKRKSFSTNFIFCIVQLQPLNIFHFLGENMFFKNR